MKRLVVLLLFFLLPVVFAVDHNLSHPFGPAANISSSQLPDLTLLKQAYNSNIDQVPSFVKKIIGTERINGHLTLNDGVQLNITAVTSGGLIDELTDGRLEDPPLIVRTDEKTVLAIMEAEDPGQRLKEAMDNKEISFEAQTFTGKVKWGISTLLMRVGLWLKNLFT
jgi:hypothetical protein